MVRSWQLRSPTSLSAVCNVRTFTVVSYGTVWYDIPYDSSSYSRRGLPCSQDNPTSIISDQVMQSRLKGVKSLESIEVLDLEGKSVSVADLWKDRKSVVGFTRHFGCVLCMKRADLLASRKDELDAANVSVIIVGPGNVDQLCKTLARLCIWALQAKAFAKSTNFPGEIYADPDFATHKAFEFVSGVGSTISLTTGLRVISAYLEGYRQDWELSFDKDTVSKGGWQQGGVLVAGPGKDNILYLFKDVKAGDEPNMDEIVAACRKA